MTDKQSPAWRRDFQPVSDRQRWGKHLLLLGVAIGLVISMSGFNSNDASLALRIGFAGLILAVICAVIYCEFMARHIVQDVCARVSKMLDDRSA